MTWWFAQEQETLFSQRLSSKAEDHAVPGASHWIRLAVYRLLLSLSVCTVYGQQHVELKIASANDNYCLNLHDGYYTNGLFIRVNYLPHLKVATDSAHQLTRITAYYQAGQMMFTPESIRNSIVDQIDRPFAGYLFIQKGMTFFYKRGHVLTTNLSLGVIGPASLAQQTQVLIHRAFDLNIPKLWSYQVKNEAGLTLQLQYWHELIPASQSRRWFDVHSTAQMTLGNTFVNGSAGFLFQWGRFEKPAQSSLYDARLGRQSSTGRKAVEFYGFFYPAYQYQVYNATVEGRLLRPNTGSILSSIEPWVYKQDVGIVYSENRWTTQLVYSSKSKEAVSMRHAEQYVTIVAAYCF